MRALLTAVITASAAGSAVGLFVHILLQTVFKHARPPLKTVTWTASLFFFLLPAAPLVSAHDIFAAAPDRIAKLLLWIWLGGAGLYLLWLLMRHFLFRSALKRARQKEGSEHLRLLAAEYGIKTPIIIKSAAAEVPMASFGAMFFPEGEYTRAENELVMRHLLAHMTGADLWLNLLLRLVQAVHWFNPAVVFFIAKAVIQSTEQSCHERVLRGMNAENAGLYRYIYNEFHAKKCKIPPFYVL